MLKVIIINGFPGSGKDTFVDMCRKARPNTKVFNVSSVDKVKLALQMLGWDGENKTPEVRNALSALKDISTELFDGPLNYVKYCIEELVKVQKGDPRNRDYVVFVHAREPKELTRYKQELGASIMLINREIDNLPENHADNEVMKFDYDYIIDNDWTLDILQRRASTFMNDILFKED